MPAEAATGAGAGRLGLEVSGQGEANKAEFCSGKNGPCDADGVDKSSDGDPSAGLGDLTEAASMWANETKNELALVSKRYLMPHTWWVCLIIRACRLRDALVVVVFHFNNLYALVFVVLWAIPDK